MADITVDVVGDNRYRVTVSEGGMETTHVVTVDPDHGQPADGEDLVHASFRFLLDREPKESILREFDLAVIARYFPEYDSKIGEYLA